MKKIRIIGTSRSGKSTLAQKLSQQYNITSYDLDELYFSHKYDRKRSKEEREHLAETLVAQSSWIIEGVYLGQRVAGTLDHADQIIFCKTSRWNICKRLMLREYRKKTPRHHTIGLIRYALNYERVLRKDIERVYDMYGEKVVEYR